MSHAIIWFIGLAFVVSIALYYALGAFSEKIKIAAICLGVGIVISLVGGFAASASATFDTEIINGQITHKERKHDTYEQPYECRCSTDSKGNRSCSTCYETHYTVKWTANSTVGNFTIKALDSTAKRVYLTADPDDYLRILIGEPASARHTYVNYIQAVPNSLFTATSKDVKNRLVKHIPAYPDSIYDRWKNDHVLSADLNITDLRAWNDDVALALRDVGAMKQVNLIFVITKTNDPNIEYAIRDSWENGNKNDVIVILGAPEYPKIEFARIITWSKNELFKIEMKEAIEEYGNADKGLTNIAINQIKKNFERRKMSEFEYLRSEIGIPLWVSVIMGLLIIGVAFMLFIKRDSF